MKIQSLWTCRMNEIINKRVEFRDLGYLDYQKAWDYQEKLFADTVALKIKNRSLDIHEQSPTENYILFVEHPHVFTLGKSGKEENLLLDKSGLSNYNAQYF